MREFVASVNRLKSLDFAYSCEKVDYLIFLDFWKIKKAKFIEAILNMASKAANIQAMAWIDLRNGPACKWTLHVERSFTLTNQIFT